MSCQYELTLELRPHIILRACELHSYSTLQVSMKWISLSSEIIPGGAFPTPSVFMGPHSPVYVGLSTVLYLILVFVQFSLSEINYCFLREFSRVRWTLVKIAVRLYRPWNGLVTPNSYELLVYNSFIYIDFFCAILKISFLGSLTLEIILQGWHGEK